MERVADLIARHFNSSREHLRFGDVSVGDVVATHGTPLFVYDAAVLDRQWRRLRAALPPEFEICYSMKANPNPAIVRRFLDRGCGLEIASSGELHQALRAGCAPGRILFAGPGKSDSELETALKAQIGEIHVESARECERILAISERLGARAPLAVRVNPGEAARGGAMQMGGKPSPFGIDEEAIDPILDRLLAHPDVDFRGVHLFTGTQILDASVLLGQYRNGIHIAATIARRAGKPLQTIDFGGGLGIPYFSGERELDLRQLQQGLVEVMRELQHQPLLAGARPVLEPGRFLVGEAGVYVTRVVDIKVSRGKTFLIVDGGMHHHLAASGNLGQVIKRNFPVALIDRLDAPSTATVDVVGPLCTPLDTLARDVHLPKAKVGDLLGILQSGAYARSASPLTFLSHPTPAEVLVDGSSMQLIRRRGTTDDLFIDFPDGH